MSKRGLVVGRGVVGMLVFVVVNGTVTGQGDPGFTNVTVEAGVTFVYAPTNDTPEKPNHAGGTEGDFDDDGWPDLFFTGGGLTSDVLFMNNQDGTFTNFAPSAGFVPLYRGNGANAADFDKDGDLDIYATSAGDVGSPAQNGKHKLWRNNGDLTFTDVAVSVGVNSTGTAADGSSVAWGDHDLDGDLDLWVGGFFFDFSIFGFKSQAKLFRNNLAETSTANFTDVTVAAGLSGNYKPYSATFADMDGDLYPDLLVAADFGTTHYFINDTDGTFTDVVPLFPGDDKVESGMGGAVADWNRDGLLDWYITGIWPAWQNVGPDGNRLYLNQGNHQFQTLPESAGVNNTAWGWGADAFDFENDGWKDLIVTGGSVHCDTVTQTCFYGDPTYLFRNNGDDTFTEVHDTYGLVHTYQGRGIIALDYDRDGDMDVAITSNPQADPNEDPATGNLVLYRNNICGPAGPNGGANYLEVVLDTSLSPELPPDGWGATVKVTTGAVSQIVNLHGGSTYLTRSQQCAHFGVADAAIVDELMVTWPNGDSTTLTNVPVNQLLTVASGVPVVPTWTDLGLGKVGSNGVPLLTGTGPLAADSLNQLDLTQAQPSAGATLVFGVSAINAPFKGGTLVPAPFALVPMVSSPGGSLSLPFLFPAGIPAGLPLYFQFWISDPGATYSLSASNALEGLTS